MSVNSRSFLILFILAILIGIAPAGCADARADVPTIERRAQSLNQSIMCPVCPGESIDQSQVALAVQMRGIVNDKLEDGWSDEQIQDFFVERYGPSVLLEPPTEGVSLAVWLAPPIGVAAAIAIFVFALRQMRRRPETERDDTDDDDLQPYYNRIESSISDEPTD